jgi:type VI protein secretion system component VasK
MHRFCSILARLLTIVTPILLILAAPALALAQIQDEPTPGESERSYAMQWGMVVLLNLVAFLLLCKPAFREDKLQKEKKTKRDKGKQGGH